jgi:hypothetical protein
MGGGDERERSSPTYDARMHVGESEGFLVDGQRVFASGYRHGPFDDDVRALLGEIRDALSEVYPLSLEQWEDGFRRDMTPAREIASWLCLARAYRRLVTQVLSGTTLPQRQGIFRVLLAALSSVEEGNRLAEQMGIPPALAQRILHELRTGGGP